jgi:CheY-like chemotaxis protein
MDAPADESSPRLLIVEDEAMVRLALLEELRSLGFDVEDAGSADEAIDKVDHAAGPIQAAIIDYNLPDRKGDALTAELRALLPDLPVVIVSAYRSDMLSAFFGRDDQVRFLGKPYRIEELVPLLHVLGIDPKTRH